ncbi:hypothetical protein CJF32_00004076 [Rutstroemia sp. NJR-2017a WRK4]|nr:hypothetical protein CJF32_00004076 [Rutstroemia sp. NJR-2017a WRK4]
MSFFSTASSSHKPLLRKHSDDNHDHDSTHDVNLRDLSPRAYASPSPPPSFYREMRSPSSDGSRRHPASSMRKANSGSESGSRSGRRIQFAAPPPPIAGSVVALNGVDGSASRSGSLVLGERRRSTSRGAGAGAGKNESLLGLERRERAIQEELQGLLDAQSLGLVQGFGGGAGEGSGSSTPTTRSLQRGGAVPVRQPKKKVVGLRGARKGLLRDMGELVGVKEEEGTLLTEEIERREECIERVKGWKVRIEHARKEIGEFVGVDIMDDNGERQESSTGKTEEDREIAELQTEERAVDTEIREMEDRLLQMKARKNWLGERIKERVNQRESRLSSYRGALREVEGEVQEFLRRPPVMVSLAMGEEGFMSLPPKRRTLEMAGEWWSKEITHLQERKAEVEKEKEALEEGAKLWSECIGVVVGFEEELRAQMRSGGVGDKEVLRKQVGEMRRVIERLEGAVKVAEERRWNLLVCAVGAELAAFKEGEEILRGALGGEEVNGGGGGGSGSGSGSGEEQKDVKDQKSNSLDLDPEAATSMDDTITDDGLRELENDLAREEEEFFVGGNGRRSTAMMMSMSGGVGLDREESDEEQHLKELLVDHEVDPDEAF